MVKKTYKVLCNAVHYIFNKYMIFVKYKLLY